MQCPKCRGASQVLESSKKNVAVFRKRCCKKCSHRWQTVERFYIKEKKPKRETTSKNYTNKVDKYYDDLHEPLGESADRLEALDIIESLGTSLED